MIISVLFNIFIDKSIKFKFQQKNWILNLIQNLKEEQKRSDKQFNWAGKVLKNTCIVI